MLHNTADFSLEIPLVSAVSPSSPCVLSPFSPIRFFCDPMDCILPGSSVHGDSPGKDTGVGCQALLRGIFLTQGSNLHLLGLLYLQVGSNTEVRVSL